MKRLIGLLLFFAPFAASAQYLFTNTYGSNQYYYSEVAPLDYTQAITVRIAPSFWGDGYLEVLSTFNNILLEPQGGTPVKPHSIITSINNKSCKGMSVAEFYGIVDTTDVISLKFMDARLDKGNVTEEHDFIFTKKENVFEHAVRYYKTNYNDPSVRVFRDKEVDFSKYRTYDYLISDAREKDLIQIIVDNLASGMLPLKRDTENPDVYIRLSLDENRNVSSTYVPPTTIVEPIGSTTRKTYNSYTDDYKEETVNNNRVTTEGGYTQTTITNALYLEIAFLDARLMQDSRQKYAPVVWSLTYKGVVYGNNDIYSTAPQVINTYCSQFPDIPNNKLAGIYMSGILYNGKGDIGYIAPDSPANKMGLNVVDKFVSIKYDRSRLKYKSWKEFINSTAIHGGVCTIQRGSKIIEFQNTMLNDPNSIVGYFEVTK